ncbi:phage tail tape measure protein [Runella zeae]|uniref:phage tail tape measure protein n=1 Tax=Runella zeae TaxID=94255 RepID=UPI00048BA684|nr:phage tail tape measure protein [Runella zeae]
MAKNSTNTSKSVIQLVVDGKSAETSVKQLGVALNHVNKELRDMKINDPQRAELLKQKKLITDEYMKQKTLIGDIRSGWSRFKSEVVQIAAGVVGGNVITALLQQLIMFIPQLINKALELRDSLADVAKATDMTDAEVKALNRELKGFNTRTATKELRDMAKVGGQFGVAKEQIAGFVKGADQVNVALGDQFGSAEATAGAVLKLRNIFQNLKSDNIEKDLLHIGNALNVLEAQGAATGAGMTDFSSRIGGVLIPLKVSEAQVLGLSATLEELNVTAERGSTATVDIFQRMLTETEAFAKVAKTADGAKMTLQEYKKLIGEDIYGAFLAYLRGLKEIQPNQIAFMAALEESKLTGAGASEVLSKLSTNQEMLAQKIKLAGDALQNTDSITAEFNKKNHELALGLKRLSEWWNGLIYNQTFQDFATGLVSLLNRMLGLTEKMDDANKTSFSFLSVIESIIDAIGNLLISLRDLTVTLTGYGDAGKLVIDVGKGIGVVFKLLATAIMVVANETATLIGYFDVLINSGKKVMNFFGGQFKINPLSNMDNLMKRRQENIDKVNSWWTTPKAPVNPAPTGGYSGAGPWQENIQTGGYSGENPNPTSSNSPNTSTPVSNVPGKKEKKELENLRKELQKLQEDVLLNSLSSYEREIKAVELKYKKLQTEAKGNAKLIKEIKELEEQEKTAIEKQYSKEIEQIRAALLLNTLSTHEKELKEVELKYEKLRTEAKGNAKLIIEIDQLEKQERTAIEEKHTRQLEKENQERIKDAVEAREKIASAQRESLEQSEKAMADYRKGKKSVYSSKGEGSLGISENDEFNAQSQLKDKYDQEIKSLRDNFNEALSSAPDELRSEMTHQFGQVLIQAEKNYYDESNQLHLDFTQKRLAAYSNLASGVSDIFTSLMEVTGENEGMFLAFQKTAAMIQIAIDTAKAISAVTADGAMVGLTPIEKALAISSSIGIVLANIAKAKKVLSTAPQAETPSYKRVPGRETGGSTSMQALKVDNSGNPAGYIDTPTYFNLGPRSWIGGEGGKQEYVIPYAMLQDPVVANIAGALEAVRPRYFAQGGSTALPSAGSSSQGSDFNAKAMMQLLAEVNAMRGDLKNLKVTLNYYEFERFEKDIQLIRDENTG